MLCMELRSGFPGLAYQLGKMLNSFKYTFGKLLFSNPLTFGCYGNVRVDFCHCVSRIVYFKLDRIRHSIPSTVREIAIFPYIIK